MYLGIDIGGTKTYVARLNRDGVIEEHHKIPTPEKYPDFIKSLRETIDKLSTREFIAAGVGVPVKIDRKNGVAISFGNLAWRRVPLQRDIHKIVGCPVLIENDANLAGLSEAMLVKHKYNKVLYLTISTGIGSGIITNKEIDPEFIDSEAGQIILEHDGRPEKWEEFASGSAIVKHFGKQAHDIHDQKSWHLVAANIAEGLLDLIPIIQPGVIIIGGGAGSYFDRFSKFLVSD